MNNGAEARSKQDWRQNSIYLVSLFVAFVGLINSYPSYWIVPRMGPFAPEIVRPLMLGAAVLIVTLKFSFAVGWAKERPSLKSTGLALDLLILTVLTFALGRFSVDMLEMVDSMVIFDGSHAAIALTAVGRVHHTLLARLGSSVGDRRHGHTVLLFHRTLLAGYFQDGALRYRERLGRRLVV